MDCVCVVADLRDSIPKTLVKVTPLFNYSGHDLERGPVSK